MDGRDQRGETTTSQTESEGATANSQSDVRQEPSLDNTETYYLIAIVVILIAVSIMQFSYVFFNKTTDEPHTSLFS